MSEMDEALQEFLVESREHVDLLETELVALEKGVTPERIKLIFRAVHTIKGSCGWFGFERLERVTHAGESVLSALRDERLAPSAHLVEALLALVDVVRECLTSVATSGKEPEKDWGAVVARLEAILDGNTSSSQPVPAEPGTFAADRDFDKPHTQSLVPGDSIRVDVTVLDRLMNQIGELVLIRNELMQLTESGDEKVSIRSSIQRLNGITAELQASVMKTRMRQIGSIWSQYPRLVRDIAAECGKRAQVMMEGAETELDRSLLESLVAPLTHLVRNAIDHGLETAERRVALGKDATGTLRVRAYHEGGQVNVELTDDGAGLDVERIRRRAIERGLLSQHEALETSERDIYQLIFRPGFSTKEEVTNLSGRGVGLDVVKSNTESIGGSVEVLCKAGQGTTFKLRIPLTLAIIPALIVRCQETSFVIPQVNLVELVHLDLEDRKSHKIEEVYGAPVYRLRGELLPLVVLSRALGMDEGLPEHPTITVLEADGQRFGLVVDDVHDTEEIVVKPLGNELRELGFYAGATIMGDGQVALILDVVGLARACRVVGEVDESSSRVKSVSTVAEAHGETVLLIKVGGGRIAMPVAAVARLEEVKKSDIEYLGGNAYVQYRDAILPLWSVGSILEERRKRPRQESEDQLSEDYVPVVVYEDADRRLGLMVDTIVDILDEPINITLGGTRKGIAGTAVIDEKVTEVLDTIALVSELSVNGHADSGEA